MLMQQSKPQKLPSSVSKFELTPPDDQDPEAWLANLDNRPTIIPAWPASTHMTLVAVVGGAAPDEVSRAFVITSRAAADSLIEGSYWHVNYRLLFFLVLKNRVLPLVNGLTLAAWAEA